MPGSFVPGNDADTCTNSLQSTLVVLGLLCNMANEAICISATLALHDGNVHYVSPNRGNTCNPNQVIQHCLVTL